MTTRNRTSLALNLHKAFSTLAKGNQDHQLYRLWRDVLSAEDDEALYEGLKLLRRALNELRRQVEACPAIVASRPVHVANIESWAILLSPKHLHHNAEQHEALLNAQRLDHLLTLNDTLVQWYPRGRLKPATVSSLKRQIDDLSRGGAEFQSGSRAKELYRRAA